MQGCDGFGCKLAGKKVIKEDTGEKEEIKMVFLDGQIMDFADNIEAVKQIKKKIVKTLSGGSLDPEIVIQAADRLAADIMSGRSYMADGEWPAISRDYPPASFAGYFTADSLRKKRRLELPEIPDCPEEGKRFFREPLGVLLHIASGNAAGLPAYSVLEGLLAGNINILKLPSGAGGLSLYILKKLTEYEPRLKEYIYILDTPSGDKRVMEMLMRLAGGIAVCGSDETVRAVRERAPVNVKIIEWGHRLSFAYIADMNVPEEKLEGLARHIFSTNQLLCSSCQVVYLDTDNFEEVKKFGLRFSLVMEREGRRYGNPLFIRGKTAVERLTQKLELAGGTERNGKKGPAERYIYPAGHGSVTCINDSRLELSGQFGHVLVKPLPQKKIFSLYPCKRHLQTAGIYPESASLIKTLARCGLTNLCSLDNMGSFGILSSHDGTFALREYTRITEYKTGSGGGL